MWAISAPTSCRARAAPASPSPSPSQLRGHNDVSRLVLDLHLTLKLGPSTSFRGEAWHIPTPWHADEPPGGRQPGTLRAPLRGAPRQPGAGQRRRRRCLHINTHKLNPPKSTVILGLGSHSGSGQDKEQAVTSHGARSDGRVPARHGTQVTRVPRGS